LSRESQMNMRHHAYYALFNGINHIAQYEYVCFFYVMNAFGILEDKKIFLLLE
jgi:hypothetical protein